MSSLAEKKFWGCPELLEKMLLSLDYDSLKSLAKAHQPVNTVLGKTLWALLIKQVTTMRGRLRSSRDLHSFGYRFMKNEVFAIHILCLCDELRTGKLSQIQSKICPG